MAEEPKALDRAGILALCVGTEPKVQPVDLPDGKGRVFVKVMPGFDLDSYQSAVWVQDTKTGDIVYRPKNRRGFLAVKCLCDAAGKRLYKDEEADMLSRMDGPLLDAIYQAAAKLNKLGADVERDAKNSSSGQSAASGSDSPPSSDAASQNANGESTPPSSPDGEPSTLSSRSDESGSK